MLEVLPHNLSVWFLSGNTFVGHADQHPLVSVIDYDTVTPILHTHSQFQSMHFIKGWALLFSPDLLHGTPLGNHIKDFSFFSYQSNEAGEHIRCHIIDMAKSKLINGEQIM
ncbi:hypothetical protein ACIXOF_03020 [Bacteroides fragilis]